ncbi:MAG: DUF1761 domain-containing protein [Bacteroidia bacterium]|jgi:hypothetical protein
MFQTFLHQTNYLAILVSALIYFIIGALWYSMLFRKQWVQLIGLKPEQMQNGSKIVFLYTFLAEIVIVFAMAFIIWILGTPDCVSAIKVGLFFSVCFTATVLAINNWYGMRSMKLTLIDAGYHIVGIVFASIILTIWK